MASAWWISGANYHVSQRRRPQQCRTEAQLMSFNPFDLLDMLMLLGPFPVIAVSIAQVGIRRVWTSWPAIWGMSLVISAALFRLLPHASLSHHIAFVAPVACFGQLARLALLEQGRQGGAGPVRAGKTIGVALMMIGLLVLGLFGLLYANSFTQGLLFTADTGRMAEMDAPAGCFRIVEVDTLRITLAALIAIGSGFVLELLLSKVANRQKVKSAGPGPAEAGEVRTRSALIAGAVVAAAMLAFGWVDHLPRCLREERPAHSAELAPPAASGAQLRG
ncbi:hypothetical protein [Paucibacter soli]|uniref:hypothetical protein n=1 Tax=Paucibacter soli TaxID=3133433 RepID=UPI0030A68362